MNLRLPAALAVALTLAVPATVHANERTDRYVGRLAENVTDAKVDGGCVVLPRVDLCGWRVRLLPQAVELQAGVYDCVRYPSWVCAWEFVGRTGHERFFCNGTVSVYRNRVVADQAADCYGDRDPTWGVTDDGLLFREP